MDDNKYEEYTLTDEEEEDLGKAWAEVAKSLSTHQEQESE